MLPTRRQYDARPLTSTFCEDMRKILIILFILFPSVSFGIEKADSVLVVKSESKLYLMKNGKEFKKYHVTFGANPKGHKLQEGDERTPEGKYILDYKKADSAFYKSIHISYPNEQDRKKAKEKGINVPLGEWEKIPRLQAKTLVGLRYYGKISQNLTFSI